MTNPSRVEGGRAQIERPTFTIITASFNQAHFLEATILSVRDQGRDDVEHLVLDGGSTDGSVEILRKHDDVLSYWVSERDGGQPAAWNAGIRRARGEIIGFLNSDDLYLPGALDEIARLARDRTDADWFVGGTLYFGEGSRGVVSPARAPRNASDVFYLGRCSAQPGHFLRRSLVERTGAIDERFQFAFDLDYFIRCALAGGHTALTERFVAAFRLHESSKTVASAERHLADARAVQAAHWPEVERREGKVARAERARHMGHLALGRVREANARGNKRAAWALLVLTASEYPSFFFQRAFWGTVQRLLGLREELLP